MSWSYLLGHLESEGVPSITKGIDPVRYNQLEYEADLFGGRSACIKMADEISGYR